MSVCAANAWRVPAEREPGVLYMHGQPGTDYARLKAIEVDGQRFERVRTCYRVLDSSRANVFGVKHRCSECNELLPEVNFCDNCGAKVKEGGDD